MNDEKDHKVFSALSEKYGKIIIFAGLAGIALIFLSGFFKSDSTASTQEVNKITAEQYTAQLETNLSNIVSSIDGAGKTKVLVTLESGVETKYATEQKNNTETTQENTAGSTTKTQQSGDSEIKYITVKDADGTERALAITEIQPKVKGVVIVCTGGEQTVVKQRIVSAVTTALGISSNKVFVTRSS